MNCQTLRDRLLAALQPARPGGAARRHLDSCAACREWHGRLVALESDLPRLYVPPALDAKAALLHAVQHGPAPADGVIRLSRPMNTTPKERGLRKLAASMALVAALALFAIGYAVWPQGTKVVSPGDPLAGRYAERDRRLADAHSASQRVETIAHLSEEVRREALTLQDRNQLKQLVRFYTVLVHDDLPAQTRGLAEKERKELINQVINQLIRAESETDQFASDPNHRSDELLALAAAAREGQVRLRAML
jgi:hypothetical protein